MKHLIFINILFTLFLSCSPVNPGYNQSKEKKLYTINYKHIVSGKSKQTVNIGFNEEITTFNPLLAKSEADHFIKKAVFSTLFYFDTQTKEIEKNLVLDYSVSEDQLAYNFILKPDIYFSNGKELTVPDVIASLKLLNQNITHIFHAPDQAFVLKQIKKNQFILKLPHKEVNLLQILCHYPILPEKHAQPIQTIDELLKLYRVGKEKPLGSGPFQIKTYHRHYCILERNPYYFKKDHKGIRLPYSDRISLHFYPDYNQQVLAFFDQKIDLLPVDYENYLYLANKIKQDEYFFVSANYHSEKIITVYNSFSQNSKPYLINKQFRNFLFHLFSQLNADYFSVSNSIIHCHPVKSAGNQPGITDKNQDLMSEDQQGNPVFLNIIMTDHSSLESFKRSLREILDKNHIIYRIQTLPLNQFLETLLYDKNYDIAFFNYNFQNASVSYLQFIKDNQLYFSPFFNLPEQSRQLLQILEKNPQSDFHAIKSQADTVEKIFINNIQFTPVFWLKKYYLINQLMNVKIDHQIDGGYDLNTIEKIFKIKK